MIAQQIKSFIRRVRLFFCLGDVYWTNQLYNRGIFVREFEVDKKNGDLICSAIAARFQRSEARLLDFYFFIKSAQLGNRLTLVLSGDNTTAIVDGINIHVASGQEIEIAAEIFGQAVYALTIDQPTVVWDIGMNVGIASLYFAANPHVKRVIGYEPFAITFASATDNFELNRDISGKIVPICTGVSSHAGRVQAAYSSDKPGDNTLLADGGEIESGVHVDIVDAQVALDNVLKEAGDAQIVCKMDVEGSEYDIIDRLAKTGGLAVPVGYVIEYHRRGSGALISSLSSAGFIAKDVVRPGLDVGYVYAWKEGSACPFKSFA